MYNHENNTFKVSSKIGDFDVGENLVHLLKKSPERIVNSGIDEWFDDYGKHIINRFTRVE